MKVILPNQIQMKTRVKPFSVFVIAFFNFLAEIIRFDFFSLFWILKTRSHYYLCNTMVQVLCEETSPFRIR